MPKSADLRTACANASPTFDEERNKESIATIKSLLAEGTDPQEKDEQGRNALMVLFEKNNSAPVIYEMVEEAKGGRSDAIPGKTISQITFDGALYDEGTPEYEEHMAPYRTWIKNDAKGPNPKPGMVLSYHFKAEEGAAEKYKKDLKTQIQEKKLKMAQVIIPALLQAGIDIDAEDKEGKTALMIAAERGDEALKQALLENNANEFDLKKLDPNFKYLTDRTDNQNIARDGGEWFSFSQLITLSVGNRRSGKYPFAQLNADNSISFFTEKEYRGNPHNIEFAASEKIKVIEEDFITEQLRYQAKKLKFPVIGGGEILEKKEGEGAASDVIEYKLNLSPHDLDSILMQNYGYRGYRNSNGEGVLSLCRNFAMKDDTIMLFPALPIEEGRELLVQAEGCQYYEMPSLQLMHLLPNYQSELAPKHQKEGFRFHWMPKEVATALCLDWENLGNITRKIFSDNGIIVSEEGRDKCAGALRIEDGNTLKTVRIAEMDDTSRNFYSLYGNLAEGELTNLKSVEVSTDAFLLATQEYLQNKVASSVEDEARLTGARNLIKEMIDIRTPKLVVVKEQRSLAARLCDLINPFRKNDPNQTR